MRSYPVTVPAKDRGAPALLAGLVRRAPAVSGPKGLSPC